MTSTRRDEEDAGGESSDVLDDCAHVSRRDVGAVVRVDGQLLVGVVVEVTRAVAHERADARPRGAHATAAERHALREKLAVVDASARQQQQQHPFNVGPFPGNPGEPVPER